MSQIEEEISDEHNEQPPEKKKRRGFFAWFLSFFAYSLLSLLMISITLVGLVHLKPVRVWTLGKVLNIVNQNLDAIISADDIWLANIGGIEIDNVRLIVAGDTLISAPQIIISPSIEELLLGNIQVNKLIIENPKIKILRDMKGIWNYMQIAKPDTTNDESQSTFEMPIIAKMIRISNAELIYKDSASTGNPNPKSLVYDNLHFNDLDIIISSKVKITDNYYRVNISELSFLEKNSGFELDGLRGKFEFSPNAIIAENSRLVFNNSVVDFQGSIVDFDLFDSGGNTNFERAQIAMDIKAWDFELGEIDRFAESAITIQNRVNLSVVFSGSMKKMNVNSLNLEAGTLEIEGAGVLNNILHSQDLSYELDIFKANFSKFSINEILPTIPLKSIEQYGEIKIKSAKAVGNINYANYEIDINGTFGNLISNGFVDWSKEIYEVNANFKNINPAIIANDKSISGNFNGKIKAKGRGFDPKVADIKLETQLYDSRYLDVKISKLDLDIASLDRGVYDLKNLNIVFNHRNEIDNVLDKPELYAMGRLNMKAINPEYKVEMSFNSLDLRKLLDKKYVPNYLTGDLELVGSGFELDSMNILLSSVIDMMVFDDRAMMPFDIDISLERENYDERNFSFKTPFVSVTANGKYSFNKMLSSLTNQGYHFLNLLHGKANLLIPENQDFVNPLPFFETRKQAEFDDLDFVVNANIDDLSLVSFFLDSIDIQSKADFVFKLKAFGDHSEFVAETIHIDYLNLKAPQMNISAKSVNFGGGLYMDIADSSAEFSFLDVKFETNNMIKLDDNLIEQPKMYLKFDGNDLDFDIHAKYNKILEIGLKGDSRIVEGGFNIDIDSTYISLFDKLEWQNKNQANIEIDSIGISIKQFDLHKIGGKETLNISGRYINDLGSLDGFLFDLQNVRIKDYIELIPKENQAPFSSLDGLFSQIKLNIDGSLLNPIIELTTFGSEFQFSNQQLGFVNTRINYKDSLAEGFVNIYQSQGKTSSQGSRFSLQINSIPIYLGVGEIENRMLDNKLTSVLLSGQKIPLALAEPFSPGIGDLTGVGEFILQFLRQPKEEMKYFGTAKVKNGSFRTLSTNIVYNASADVTITTNKIRLDSAIVSNLERDNRGGRGKAYGEVLLNGTQIDYLDIYFDSPNLQVLSDATRMTMPFIYGKFRMATGDKPLRFFGTLDKPNLEGDVNILEANLFMPQPDITQVVSSQFKYETRGDQLYFISELDTNKSKENEDNEMVASRSFADLINYALNIRFLGRFDINMDIALATSLQAKIGSPDRNRPIRFVKKRDAKEAEVMGEILVLDNSKMKFANRTFQTGGKLGFPTGSVANPSMDLKASFKGITQVDGNNVEFEAILSLTGTKEKPILHWSYRLGQEEIQGDQAEIQKDVIFLLTFGKTSAEMNRGGQSYSGSLTDEALNSAASYLMSSSLNQIAGNIGLIKSADIDWTGSFENSTIRLRGDLIGGVQWAVGSNFSTAREATREYVVEFPLLALFSSNFALQAKYVDGNQNITLQDDLRWQLKLRLSGSW